MMSLRSVDENSIRIFFKVKYLFRIQDEIRADS